MGKHANVSAVETVDVLVAKVVVDAAKEHLVRQLLRFVYVVVSTLTPILFNIRIIFDVILYDHYLIFM